MHSENILADLFQQREGPTSGSLDAALRRIGNEGRGVLVYMTHPCGGLNLPREPGRGCHLEPRRMDFRGYGIGAQILASLGLKKIRILTNSSRKVIALDGYGLEIVEQVALR